VKYLLNTDVVSQYTKVPPNPRVDAWMQYTDDREMYICDITFAELWYGVHLLPAGKKRTALEQWLEDDLYMQFFNRVVFMGLDVARHYGSLMARAKKNGFTPQCHGCAHRGHGSSEWSDRCYAEPEGLRAAGRGVGEVLKKWSVHNLRIEMRGTQRRR
jgi:toxin FitB